MGIIYRVQVRSGVLINDDPQRRCYDGAYFASHMEWGEWRKFLDFPTRNLAEMNARLFQRHDQQLRVVEIEDSAPTGGSEHDRP